MSINSARIFAFHIQNTKVDYALAFQYVMKGSKGFSDEVHQNWASEHIYTLCYSFDIKYGEPTYKRIISYYEERYIAEVSPVSHYQPQSPDDPTESDYYYFRVCSNDEDDIVNLHYFFLLEKPNPRNFFLGIITTEKRMHFKISDYLFYESLTRGKHNRLKIVHSKNRKQKAADYQIELINEANENVFFLSFQGEHFVPSSIHKKGLNSSRSFFPQMQVRESLYFAFSETSEDFCNSIISAINDVEPGEGLYSKDLLYEIAVGSSDSLPITEDAIQQSLSKTFPFVSKDVTRAILRYFCCRCFNAVISDLSSTRRTALKVELISLLQQESSNSTILAICYFLAFISRLPNNEKGTEKRIWLDVLTDAQDYAAGTLQLLENIIKHVPSKKGLFCFRIHNCTKIGGHLANTRLAKRYSVVNQETDGYFLEVLISDFNLEADIPETFKKNILVDMERPDDQKEYSVSKELFSELDTFQLRDLFDFEWQNKTHNAWHSFYSKSKNLTSHYGLLVFEHLVAYAGGAFHVISSKDYVSTPSQRYLSCMTQRNESEAHIPGTQYEILLPIGVSRTPFSTGLLPEVDIKSEQEQKGWQLVLINENDIHVIIDAAFRQGLTSIDEIEYRSYRPYFKAKAVHEIRSKVQISILNGLAEKSPDHCLVLCDVSKIDTMTASEIFVKAIIELLFEEDIYLIKHFAFINAKKVFLTTFIRTFSILYMKSDQSLLMNGRQIHLSSPTSDEEVFFYGHSLWDSYAITYEALHSGRGMDTHSLQILYRELEKVNKTLQVTGEKKNVLTFNHALFKNKALEALNTDIQNGSFGCCLHDIHMRIGSKIHIHGNYYEASLLFSMSGYVSHFAYYVADSSITAIAKGLKEGRRKFIIIGYETYSELLAIYIKDYLRIILENIYGNIGIDIDYIIYNEAFPDNKFFRWDESAPNSRTGFIVVVPIGSTLTTHDKIVADLLRAKYPDGSDMPTSDSILLHHALVIIRDSDKKRSSDTGLSRIENIFWEKLIPKPLQHMESLSGDGVTVIYRTTMANIGADNYIQCYLVVENEWLLPDECQYCFPKQSELITEEPLVLANRASVVPMTMIGLKDGDEPPTAANVDVFIKSSIEQSLNENMPLESALCYGHVTRDDDNHFEYYFLTDKVMETILASEHQHRDFFKKLQLWGTLETQKIQGHTCFDYVVAPLHSTNANFVYHVSKYLNTRQIIWLDIKKDFRGNIKSKYSNLTSLYNNSIEQKQGENVVIRFHYVDDTINSGDSFYRAKSLILSLFPKNKKSENVKLEVFRSIFLLLNRCSLHTQDNFIDKPEEHFHAFINLKVSSMRNHNDACIACNNEKTFFVDIPEHSSTSDIASISLKNAMKYTRRDAEKIEKPIQMILPNDAAEIEKKEILQQDSEIAKKMKRNFYRLILSHRMNDTLGLLGASKNVKNTVESIIWLELNDIASLPHVDSSDSEKQVDLFFSALKVITRPFLSFRKSVSEAAMSVLLKMSDYFLNNQTDSMSENSAVSVFIDRFTQEKIENKIHFIELLFSCLAIMRSTFLVRTKTIKSLLTICDTFPQETAEKLIRQYVFYVKRILCVDKKSNLSLWLERLLHNEETLSESTVRLADSIPIQLSHYKCAQSLRNLLFIENIMPICEALAQCKKAAIREHNNMDQVITNTLGHYYCRGYCEFSNIDPLADEDAFKIHCSNVFSPMLKLYAHLVDHQDAKQNDRSEDESWYYNELLKYVREILGTNKTRLYTHIPPDQTRIGWEGGGVIPLFPHRIRQEDTLPDDLTTFVENIAHNQECNATTIGNTLFYKNVGTRSIGAIKIVNTSIDHSSEQRASEYYLAFEWGMIYKDLDIISMARNLLAMRSHLVERIIGDFDNHIKGDFLELQEKVLRLSTDKSGSHTPFVELAKLYDQNELMISQLTKNIPISDESISLLRYYTNQLHLVSDAIISKWYVHSIVRSYPDKLNPNNVKISVGRPLSDCREILYSLIYGNIHEDGADVFADESTQISTDSWGEVEIDCPDRCLFIWCCAVIASYYNALRHGRVNDEEANSHIRHVKVRVSYSDGYIYIRNMRQDNNEKAKRSRITLDALRYFFDTFYGNNEFYSGIDPVDNQKYLTKIPCKSKEVKSYGADSRY